MIEKKHGGARKGAGRNLIDENSKKKPFKVYMTQEEHDLINLWGSGKTFSTKVLNLLYPELKKRLDKKKIKFIDLFAGLGGLRIGFEQAFKKHGYETECILTSEIKPAAIEALSNNFPSHNLQGDITNIKSDDIEDFDFLLGGFPCQAFSSAGKGLGFADTRGTLFFEVERILRDKKPYGFILENVEGLITHDKDKNSTDEIGKTLNTILMALENLGYKVTWKLLEAQNFGVPQLRKRVFIVGSLKESIDLDNFTPKYSILNDVLEKNKPVIDSHFTRCLLKYYSPENLYGKAIKDKRGGENNIHSWDIDLRGAISEEQKTLMELLFKQRRKKSWAQEIGIEWMDGMPLTLKQISTFYNPENLEDLLNDLVEKKYLTFEHPKAMITTVSENGLIKKERKPDLSKPKGYNIVAGKLSFEFTKILDSFDVAPTLVAADVAHLGVIDGNGIRRLTLKEGLRLFGFPESYSLNFFEEQKNGMTKAFDLLGNTVAVPVVEAVAERLCFNYTSFINKK